jgi:HEAT repeat protein
VRAEAVTALGADPETDAATEIVPLLNDPDEAVQSAAAQVVLRATDMDLRRRGLDVLQGMLRSDKREARLRGMFLLGELGVKKNKRLLEGAIADPDPEVRLAALVALGKLVEPGEDTRFLAEVERQLADENPEIRLAAAAVARTVGGGQAVRLLEGCLDQRGYKLRRLAVEGLAELGDEGRMALARAVGDSAVALETREFALQTVRKSGWGEEEMRRHFVPLAEKELRGVYLRTFERRALRRLGEQNEAVQLLLRILDDLDEEASTLCISIITTMANPEKIKLIRKALASGTRQTRANVLELLENASERNLFNLLMPLLDRVPVEELRELARKQFQAAEPEPDAVLRTMIGSRNLTVRLSAIYAVGELGLVHLAGELRQLSQDPFAGESLKAEVERALRVLEGR